MVIRDGSEEFKQDATFKLCIFGDGGVGKTTLVNKFLTGVFSSKSKLTIGLDFHIKVLKFNGLKVKLQIWDFAGEERFRFLLPSYIKGASGGVFMFDITRYSSLKNIDNWLEVLKKGAPEFEKEKPILLVGGNSDLEEKRAVKHKETHKFVKNHNIYDFIECSSKTGVNIGTVFESITQKMFENENPSENPRKYYSIEL
jgi:small GTP-binding protein